MVDEDEKKPLVAGRSSGVRWDNAPRASSARKLSHTHQRMSAITGHGEHESVCTTAKHKMLEFMELKHYQFFLFVVTIYTLFADDTRELTCDKSSDSVVHSLMFVCLVVFLLELLIMSWAKTGYLCALYFWLDMVAIVSIIPDIPWLAEAFLGMFGENYNSMQTHEVDRASRATRIGTRAGRLARLIRLIRLVRVIRAFRIFTFLFSSSDTSEKEGESGGRVGERRGIAHIQDKMFTTVVENISKRVVIVVLMVIFASFACEDFTHDYSRVDGLLSLDAYSLNFDAGESSTYIESYEKSYNKSVSTYVAQQPRLIYLSIKGRTLLPETSSAGFCCVGPNGGRPTNTDYLRDFELMKYRIASDEPGVFSAAYFDLKNERQNEAKWQLILLLLVIVLLVGSSFDFSYVSIALIRHPVEHLVVADQTMGALLEVFKAVTSENENTDETMNTITGACCKALDAERTNLWIMDPMRNRLECRYQAQLNLEEIIETKRDTTAPGSIQDDDDDEEYASGIQFQVSCCLPEALNLFLLISSCLSFEGCGQTNGNGGAAAS
jgi:hypothetical protein